MKVQISKQVPYEIEPGEVVNLWQTEETGIEVAGTDASQSVYGRECVSFPGGCETRTLLADADGRTFARNGGRLYRVEPIETRHEFADGRRYNVINWKARETVDGAAYGPLHRVAREVSK